MHELCSVKCVCKCEVESIGSYICKNQFSIYRIEFKYKTNQNKSKDKNTKVFRILLTKSRHTFSRLVYTSVKRLSSMHILLLLQKSYWIIRWIHLVKESQRILNWDQIIYCICRSQLILVSIQSFDVLPDETQWISNVLLFINNNQSQFCYTIEMNEYTLY